jgi:hypothetical protein
MSVSRVWLAAVVAAAVAGLVGVAGADRGSIPFKPDVEIFEPVQRALIAWNGTEEILLLSTDLRASAPTKVLEVLPLPSEPKVKEGDLEAFKTAVKIINSRQRRLAKGAGKSLGTRETAEELPAGEVTFHEKIGAHDISVTHVLDGAGFITWVEDYLKKQDVENPTIPEPLKEVVGEYLKDGFTWFVFDVVELGETTKTSDAIQYRFETSALYYPLKITRTETGDTSVELLILTPRLLRDFPGLPISRVKLAHEPVRLSDAELKSINQEMYELLGKKDGMMLRIWRITGALSKFTSDLLAK